MAVNKVQLSKEARNFGFDNDVFLAILYSSMNPSKDPTQIYFPSKKEGYILRELVGGVSEYVTGKKSELPEVGNFFNPPLAAFYNVFCEAMKKDKKLDEDIRSSLERRVKPYDISGTDYTESITSTGINDFVEVMLPDFFLQRKKTSLPYAMVLKAEREIIPGLNGRQIQNVTGIGKLMRNYIEEDLKALEKG
ncbi:MAG: hypothetical protein AABW50_02910 [Nanoarchaeota archaeon]